MNNTYQSQWSESNNINTYILFLFSINPIIVGVFVFYNEIDSLNIISWFDKIKKDNLQ